MLYYFIYSDTHLIKFQMNSRSSTLVNTENYISRPKSIFCPHKNTYLLDIKYWSRIMCIWCPFLVFYFRPVDFWSIRIFKPKQEGAHHDNFSYRQFGKFTCYLILNGTKFGRLACYRMWPVEILILWLVVYFGVFCDVQNFLIGIFVCFHISIYVFFLFSVCTSPMFSLMAYFFLFVLEMFHIRQIIIL